MIRVLVTGAGALLGQGILRCLKSSDLDLHIIGVDPNPLSVGLYWADEAYTIPMVQDSRFSSAINELLDQTKPDVVFIGTDVELLFFSRNRLELEAKYNTRILVSDEQVIRIANDKWLTYQFLKDNGFSYPKSCLPGDEERLIDEIGFPLIVKPRIGARSIGVHLVHNINNLRDIISEDAIIQEAVGSSNQEYTAGTLTLNKNCDAVIIMRRDLRDGNTYRAYVSEFPELKAHIEKIATRLGAYGPANFQFRLSPEGTIKIFEVNARFSGTTPFRMLAGFNEVDIMLRNLIYDDAVHSPEIQETTILRYWTELVTTTGKVDSIKNIPGKERL